MLFFELKKNPEFGKFLPKIDKILGSIGFLYLVTFFIVILSVNPRQASITRMNNLMRWDDNGFAFNKETGSRYDWEIKALYYKLMIQAFPKLPDAYGAAGYCYARINRSDFAEKYFQDGLSRFPRNFWFLYNAAVVEYSEGHQEKAIRYFRDIVHLSEEEMNRGAVLAPLASLPEDQRKAFYGIALRFASQIRESSWRALILMDAARDSRDSALQLAEEALKDNFTVNKAYFLKKVIFLKNNAPDAELVDLSLKDIVLHPWLKAISPGKEYFF
ncbi:MAG: hypothetical protein HQL16_05450 [Candidatus Omnitrophica bacterium]|nr:hypothetical protein [Candidatus Omnitrophota bacterium]